MLALWNETIGAAGRRALRASDRLLPEVHDLFSNSLLAPLAIRQIEAVKAEPGKLVSQTAIAEHTATVAAMR
jgi:hypothetical protein